jgi:hypothetical protein
MVAEDENYHRGTSSSSANGGDGGGGPVDDDDDDGQHFQCKGTASGSGIITSTSAMTGKSMQKEAMFETLIMNIQKMEVMRIS